MPELGDEEEGDEEEGAGQLPVTMYIGADHRGTGRSSNTL